MTDAPIVAGARRSPWTGDGSTPLSGTLPQDEMTPRRRWAAQLLGTAPAILKANDDVGVQDPSEGLFSSSSDVRREAQCVVSMAALVYQRAIKKRRRQVDRWLRRGKLLCAVRLLLNVEDIVKYSNSSESSGVEEIFEVCSFDDEPTDASFEQHRIKVPSIADCAAALGLSNASNPTAGLQLEQRRQVNMAIVRIALSLVNEQGDQSVGVGKLHSTRVETSHRRKRRVEDMHLSTAAIPAVSAVLLVIATTTTITTTISTTAITAAVLEPRVMVKVKKGLFIKLFIEK